MESDRLGRLILAVEAGHVVERGNHAELLAKGGLYARLHMDHFAGGKVEARCADGVLSATARY
jgi:ATP-binding cassette subfamily B protein